jgi:hypothetical protein
VCHCMVTLIDGGQGSVTLTYACLFHVGFFSCSASILHSMLELDRSVLVLAKQCGSDLPLCLPLRTSFVIQVVVIISSSFMGFKIDVRGRK